MSLFEYHDVHLVVDGTVVLAGLQGEIPEHGITVLVGPSGGGKSTTLRLCNRLVVPTAGRVLYNGTDVATLDPLRLRREVGMVFQRPTLFDGNVLDNLRVAVPSLTREQALAVLDRVGLDEVVLDRDSRDLSGGEAQRACVARTLVTEPHVLLMDEPTSALDADNVHRIEHIGRDLASSGVPVVWVSHDRAQVRRIADHVVRIEAGRIVESGTATAMGHVHDDEGLWRDG